MSVKVAVRVRPFNSRERKLECSCVVDMQDPSTKLVAHKGQEERTFTFDYSFWSFDKYQEQEDGYLKALEPKYADQKVVFQKIGTSILDNAWQGYHCCLFAYGQTGSGKSYSMIGYGLNKGIVPITCNEIFQRIKEKKGNQEYEVTASMLEIYNEEVQDLTISPSQRVHGGLKIRQNKLLGVYVDGIKKHFVSSFAAIEQVMEEGTQNRTVAATQMNATSSRAHTIITIEFKQIDKSTKSEKISVINLVDLAGSQRQDKTGASGQRLKEAVGINQSLTALGQVISILAENADGKNQFVPYRNSVLTRILSSALGGNSQTIMICAISPASDNYDQTLSTLRYAERAKKIKNKPIVNESESDKLIRQLKQENQRLKKLLSEKQGNISKQQPKNQDGKIQVSENEEADEEDSEEEVQEVKQQKLGEEKKEEKNEEKNEDQKEKAEEKDNKKEKKKNRKKRKKKNKKQKGQKKQEDSSDDEAGLIAKLQYMEQQLRNHEKPRAKREEEEKQWLQETHKLNAQMQPGMLNEKLINLMTREGKKIPPYLQNISKDIMIDRKLKIQLSKPLVTVGKVGAEPANDILFGGRDVMLRHCQIETVEEKVFLKPINKNCHLYVNGQQITQGRELTHLDRVIFGWNSVYVFKNKAKKTEESGVKDKDITWDYVANEVAHLVDIDASDTEDGGGACCLIM